jgi:hypothetical protein
MEKTILCMTMLLSLFQSKLTIMHPSYLKKEIGVNNTGVI